MDPECQRDIFLLQRIHLCWGEVQLHALVKWSLEIREGKLITWEQTPNIASGNATSSTAQGGGGSFKNRKRIGDTD